MLAEDSAGNVTEALIASSIIEEHVGVACAEFDRLKREAMDEAKRRIAPLQTFLRGFKGAMDVRVSQDLPVPLITRMAPLPEHEAPRGDGGDGGHSDAAHKRRRT